MSRRPLVLILDDEPSILKSTALLLEDLGFGVCAISRHEDVVAAAHRERPDIILQDVRMPGLDLPSLVQSLRSDAVLASIPIVLFSASMDIDEVAEKVHVADRLEKPFKPHEIQEILHRVLKNRA